MYRDPLWGGVVPQINDLLFGWLFPFGYMFFFLNLFYLSAIGLFLLVDFSIRKYKYHEKSSLGHQYLKPFFLIGVFGIFFTPFVFGALIFLIIKVGFQFKALLFQPKIRIWARICILLILFICICIPFIPLFFSYFRRQSFVTYLSILYGILLIIDILYIFTRKTNNSIITRSWNLPIGLKKTGWVLYFCCLFLFSGVFFSNFLGIHTQVQPNTSNNQDILGLTIISYNIRYGTAKETNPLNNWDIRSKYVADYVSSLNGDIIGLQEALLFQLDYIVEHTTNRRYIYTGLGRDDGVHGGEHSAILFDADKFEILDGDTFWLSETPNFPSRTWKNGHYRICTWALFEEITSHKQFYVFCTHFQGGDYFNTKAIALMHQKVSEFTANAPVFVIGDMNMHTSDSSYARFIDTTQTKPLRDSFVAYHNNTDVVDYSVSHFNATEVPTGEHRIDFIFVSEHVNVILCDIPKASYGTNQTYSDHYPVVLNCIFS